MMGNDARSLGPTNKNVPHCQELPIGNGREWSDDEKRSLALFRYQMGDKRDALDSFTQTHLVSQDAWSK